MARVLLAPDKFKGTLTAAEVAGYLAEGLRSSDIEIATVPVADGGDGLLDAFEAAGFERVPAVAAGPTGIVGATTYVRRDDEAVVELAAVAGLAQLGGELAPLTATSRGVGEVIAAALDAGCTRIVLGIGGSASTDGGLGMIQALGAQVLDAAGADVGAGGLGAQAAVTLDLHGLHPALAQASFEVACDVDNPLTGPHGAAAVYGPQKGADPEQVELLDRALSHWADVVAAATGVDRRDAPGAGAAGGVGFAALAVLGATLRPGVDLVLDLMHFPDELKRADLVVTGEGSLDEQTLRGKAPAGVAAAARAAGIPAVAVAGRCLLDATRARAAGFEAVYTLVDEASRPDEPFTDPGPLLRRIGARIADRIAELSALRRAMTAPGADNSQSKLKVDLAIRARRAIVDGAERSCTIGISDGRIAAVEPLDADTDAGIDADNIVEIGDDEVLLPGLVDTHVHVNEPGRTEWEGFASATRAAAAGGVTTIVDMPLNSIPPTTTVAGLAAKQERAAAQAYVDVGFWGGAVPGNLPDIAALHDAGVFGFKCFLVDSGVAEFPPLSAAEFVAAMTETAKLGALLIVHAEDASVIAQAPAASGVAYPDFLRSRPHAAEDRAIGAVIDAAKASGGRAHVLHLSSADALPELRAARAAGVDISVETCPHYLAVDADHIPDGATQFKCCPPIRDAANQDRLWTALADGDIDMIVSDHSPCTAELKRFDTGDFGAAWGGIASVQVGLPVVWTAAQARGRSLADVVRWMATAPADRVGLTHKGRIEVGADADLCVFDPDAEFVVDPARLLHKNPVCAYAGRQVTGVVRQTWLRGRPVDVNDAPRGQLIKRGGR